MNFVLFELIAIMVGMLFELAVNLPKFFVVSYCSNSAKVVKKVPIVY